MTTIKISELKPKEVSTVTTFLGYDENGTPMFITEEVVPEAN